MHGRVRNLVGDCGAISSPHGYEKLFRGTGHPLSPLIPVLVTGMRAAPRLRRG